MSEVRLVQETLAAVFAHALGFTNVRGATSLAEARQQITTERPAIVMIDATLADGKVLVKFTQNKDLSIRLIAFCVADAASTVAEWGELGVSACLTRAISCKEAAELIKAVVSGSPLGRGLVPAALANDNPCTILTEREQEVARLIGAALSNKDIARAINVSLATVKSHVHNLLAKLGLKRRTEVAIWYAGRQPVIEPPASRNAKEFATATAPRDFTLHSLSLG